MAATVDQGGNVLNACKSLGLSVHPCRAHRIDSAVMWMLDSWLNGHMHKHEATRFKGLPR